MQPTHHTFRSAIWNIFNTKHDEFWNIWTSIAPLAILLLMLQTDTPKSAPVAGVFFACIASQLCSTVYHTFHCISLRATRALYNLDLAGVCCMSFGSPWLYMNAYGTDGLAVYLCALFTLTSSCMLMLLRSTRCSK